MTDVLIIGGGPAGLTAAIYAARAGKSVTICEQEAFGGQITQAEQVDNYPGLPGITGMELGDKLLSQAMDAGAEVAFTAVTSVVKLPGGLFSVETEDGPMEARSVIFAGGARPRPLGLDREEELVGQGVSYCALCDGAFYEGQDVAIVGGGSTAFSDALYLAGLCRSVTLIHRREGFRAEPHLVDQVKGLCGVRLLTSATVQALVGEEQLEAVAVETPRGLEALPVQGLFVALGRVPDCSLIADLSDLDPQGYALCGEDCRTKTAGLYVAGDCRCKQIRQLTTAVADGTCAAMSCIEDLAQARE